MAPPARARTSSTAPRIVPMGLRISWATIAPIRARASPRAALRADGEVAGRDRYVADGVGEGDRGGSRERRGDPRPVHAQEVGAGAGPAGRVRQDPEVRREQARPLEPVRVHGGAEGGGVRGRAAEQLRGRLPRPAEPLLEHPVEGGGPRAVERERRAERAGEADERRH